MHIHRAAKTRWIVSAKQGAQQRQPAHLKQTYVVFAILFHRLRIIQFLTLYGTNKINNKWSFRKLINAEAASASVGLRVVTYVVLANNLFIKINNLHFTGSSLYNITRLCVDVLGFVNGRGSRLHKKFFLLKHFSNISLKNELARDLTYRSTCTSAGSNGHRDRSTPRVC